MYNEIIFTLKEVQIEGMASCGHGDVFRVPKDRAEVLRRRGHAYIAADAPAYSQIVKQEMDEGFEPDSIVCQFLHAMKHLPFDLRPEGYEEWRNSFWSPSDYIFP